MIAMRNTLWLRLIVFAIGVSAAVSSSAEIPEYQLEFFENKIRPILSGECYECHNTHGKQKSGLVLDHAQALLAGGDGYGPAVIAGKPDESPLIWALRHEQDLEMPKAGVSVGTEVIADFEKWVAMGAPDPRTDPPTEGDADPDADWPKTFERRKEWWSFQPIADSQVPPATRWSDQPIDRFVHARMSSENLKPSPPADAEILVRRIYFNLIGLPPTPEQVDVFKAAHQGDPEAAFVSLVDQLLASPHFGEKWARHWMDWVRYAESHGSEGDPRIPNAHLYRDYLIRAINADIPYNQLVREHVAGDLLSDPRIDAAAGINESMIGPAHFRMVFHGFAPTDALDERTRFQDDLINVFTKSFQGLTVSCARCHNHKFDAISQADFYALMSVFGSTRPGSQPIETTEVLNANKTELAELKPKIRSAIAIDWIESINGLAERLDSTAAEHKTGRDSLGEVVKKAKEAQAKGEGGAFWKDTLEKWDHIAERGPNPDEKLVKRWNLGDPKHADEWFRHGNGLGQKPSPPGEFLIEPNGDSVVTGVFPAGIVANALSQKHVARLSSPDVVLDGKYELRVMVAGGGNALVRPVIQNFPRKGTVFPITRLKVADPKEGEIASGLRWQTYNRLDYWEGDSVHIELNAARDGAVEYNNTPRSWFAIREAVFVEKGTKRAPKLFDEIRSYLRTYADQNAATSLEVAQVVEDALRGSVEAWANGEVTDAGALLIDQALREKLLPNTLAELAKAWPLVTTYRKLESDVPAATRIPALAEWQGQDRPLYIRGDHKKPADLIPRRYLDTVDSKPFTASNSGRLELSEALLREDNPFTRRVIVNRLWHHLFGRGIVASPDNFGRLGEAPSHPELLDYLASQFSAEQSWSLKAAIRSMVLSMTWRQASVPSEHASNQDPGNSLLSHYSVRRLEAESIRDSLLFVSSQLDPKMPSGQVGGHSHRSVYQPVIRNSMNAFLSAFDHPVPFAGKGARNVTNVPAQALTMMNDGFVVSASGRLNARFSRLNTRERTTELWRSALGRVPNQTEIDAVEAFIAGYGKTDTDVVQELAETKQSLSEARRKRAELLEPVRSRLQAEMDAKLAANEVIDPVDSKPIAAWDFGYSTTDQIGGIAADLQGAAKLADGALVLDGKGALFTKPIPVAVSARTLEVLVELDSLDQRGGGAMTIQSLNGEIFDSIVFAERRNREWMAGSNHFARTEDFAQAKPESEADGTPVLISIVYQSNGMIQGFRNGVPLGKGYRSKGLQKFDGGKAQIAFGIRHGTGVSGSRMLKGKIYQARLYDRALTAEEISLSAGTVRTTVTEREVIDALSGAQRSELDSLDRLISSTESTLTKVHRESGKGPRDPWQAVALSVLNLKEFIYIR